MVSFRTKKDVSASDKSEYDELVPKFLPFKGTLAASSYLIDIGSSDGRFIDFYRSHFNGNVVAVGIDPLDTYSYVCEYERVTALIGNKCCMASISISDDKFSTSKFYGNGPRFQIEQHTAECVMERLQIPQDIKMFVKIDTQGADLECLESFGRYKANITMVIVEIQILPYSEGMKYFNESVCKIADLGFRVCDFANPVYRNYNGMLGQIDLILIPDTSTLLKDFEW
jgi:hypothetical protein